MHVRYLRFLLLASLPLLGSCGYYNTKVIYAVRTTQPFFHYDHGSSCFPPSSGAAYIAYSKAVHVSVGVDDKHGQAVMTVNVDVSGGSNFRFLDDHVKLKEPNSRQDEIVTLGPFSRRGHMRLFQPMDELASLTPYGLWPYTSITTLPTSAGTAFAVRLPAAEVDGQRISFPLASFKKKIVGYRMLCLQ